MKQPSKASFAEGLKHARQINKPVIVGWSIAQRLNSPASIEVPRHGKADTKSTRWYRQNFRDAWVVSPDGSAYNVFDAVASSFMIEEKTVKAHVAGHGMTDVPVSKLAHPSSLAKVLAPIMEKSDFAITGIHFFRPGPGGGGASGKCDADTVIELFNSKNEKLVNITAGQLLLLAGPVEALLPAERLEVLEKRAMPETYPQTAALLQEYGRLRSHTLQYPCEQALIELCKRLENENRQYKAQLEK
jgi:hypothetical protein